MSQLEEIKTAQDNLEECFAKRMAELEAQLHSGGPTKDTVARVAEEFRTFRELMFSMIGLLRKQINECSAAIDDIETRHRRKSLIFVGVAESEQEDCKTAILDAVHRMELKNVTVSNITVCHRIGAQRKDHNRPILVRFSDVALRSAVWRSKTKLKGSPVAVKEFLTRVRQSIFLRARQHFGIRAAWTNDGVILVKSLDGNRHKITTPLQLDILIQKYPKAGSSSDKISAAASVAPGVNNKQRK